MGKLIDAESIKKYAVPERLTESLEKEAWYWTGWNSAIDKICEDAPPVDAVPVVRCKDCRYYEPDFGCPWGGCNHPDWSTRTLGFEVSEDGFCHRAERREGDGDGRPD